MKEILYVDLETTANGGPKGDDPEAHWHVNKVLVWGYAVGRSGAVVDSNPAAIYGILKDMQDKDNPVIVAHNLKFDLKYLMREFPSIKWHKFDYFDTATMHYLWSGHRDKFPSFEFTCDKWDVQYKKTLDLTQLLNNGVKMEDIDIQDLKAYCRDDVEALIRLHNRMVMDDWVYKQESTNWVAPLAEMELYGLKVDEAKCNSLLTRAAQNAIDAENDMQTLFRMYCSWDSGHALDWSKISVSAPRTVSALLTGKPNRLTKHKTRTLDIMSFPKLPPDVIDEVWGDVKPTHLGYPMSEYYVDRLLDIDENRLSLDTLYYVECLMKYRKWNKLASTYFSPFLESAKIQGTVHPSMNTQATATGRLSSSNPNGQNMPPEAREVFCARGTSKIYELDFKQLEIVSAAWWSGDRQLMIDLNSGEDVHFNSGKDIMGWRKESDMTEEDRRIVKGVNFGLLFGGGPEGLSKSTGTDKSTVKSLIKGFFDRYPGVEDWQEQVYTDVCDAMQAHSIEKGEQRYCSWYESNKLHRRWYFLEKPAPGWVKKRLGRSFSFKPTETKNYPVQGFAGGDIVMTFLWLLWCMIYEKNLPISLTMTVHDSIILETSMDEADIRKYTDAVRTTVRKIFDIKVPLNYEIKGGGSHWR